MSEQAQVNLSRVNVSYGSNLLFEALSFSVHAGELIALAGANGCGKSTVLNLVAGRCERKEISDDSSDLRVLGEISPATGIQIAYLPQKIGADVGRISTHAAGAPDGGSAAAKLLGDFGLQYGDSDLRQTLSGGELQKLALVDVLSMDVDLYLFDEPTNYLDLDGIVAFEEHLARLKSQRKAILLVTHDREITDHLADRTVLLSPHGIHIAPGGSSAAQAIQTEEYQARRHQAAELRKKINQLQQDSRARAGWAASKEKQKKGAGKARAYIAKMSKKMAKRSKAVQRRADKKAEELNRIKPFVPRRINLKLPSFDVRHREVFSLRGVSFDYGRVESGINDSPTTRLLHHVDLSASTRDRICLMGANGSGKSTILNIIRQMLTPCEGSCHVNESVPISVLPQGLQGVFEGRRLLDHFSDCGYSETVVRQYLGAALIRKDKVRDPVESFSYGELMRAAIVKAILARAEFLILDEPTSHLDIESIQILEHVLTGYPGGIIFVSHDRRFVENMAEKLYLLEQGRLRLV